MKKLLLCVLAMIVTGMGYAANVEETGKTSEEAMSGVVLRSNQKLVASNGDYLYLYTNGHFSLDASTTMGKNYSGTYQLTNSGDTIVLTYSTGGESESWSGRVTWVPGSSYISSINIMGQVFRR